jgi:hypothetical protein
VAYPEELSHNPYQPNTLGIDLNTLPLEQQLELHQRRLLALYRILNSADKSTISSPTLGIWSLDIRDTISVLDKIRWDSDDTDKADKLSDIIEEMWQADSALTLGREALELEATPLEARKKLYEQILLCRRFLEKALKYFKGVV